MSGTLHIYTAPHDSALRYDLNGGGRFGEEEIWQENKPNRKLTAMCCYQRRAAKNLTVQVFYDDIRFWCVEGKGCKSPVEKRRKGMRVYRKPIFDEFLRGLSFVGIARKRGITAKRVEQIVRGWLGMPR